MTERALVFVKEPVVNLYGEPDGQAEVVSQARLGEEAGSLETAGSWTRVEMTHDRYRGWVERRALSPGAWPPEGATVTVRNLFANVYASPKVQAPLLATLALGTPLPLREEANADWRQVELPEGRTGFVQVGDVCEGSTAWAWAARPELQRSLVRTARQLLGLPYRWGGTTPWGIDCSGLVQLVYRLHGFVLPRDASDQAADPRTRPVARPDLAAGDLLFFANHGHVGLAISADHFLHATTHLNPIVQVSEVDDPYWTSRRDEIRRPRVTEPGEGGLD